jgi:hypothetical protein
MNGSRKTHYIVTGIALFALVGLAITVAERSSSSNKGAFSVPPPTASSSSTVAPATGGSTSEDPNESTTTPVASATGGVILGPTQSHGDWTSAAFVTSAPNWKIGWAFKCTSAPDAGPSFRVSVAPVGASATPAPAISETGPSGQSVSTQTTLGRQTLVVQAPADCAWAIKVSGS